MNDNVNQQRPMPRVDIVPMLPQDIAEAGRVMRLAFGTFLGLPDPMTFMGDTDYAGTRFRADPSSAFTAKLDGKLIGSVFASKWGSVGVLGPISVDPQFWDKGIAGKLMEQAIHTFDQWGIELGGLFTFPHSAKHLGLYQRFGFWPKYLTSLLSKPVVPQKDQTEYQSFSSLSQQDREPFLESCFSLTSRIYSGMDLRREIEAVALQKLGDILFVGKDEISGFAICHAAKGSEAPSGVCYVKFAAVIPGKNASTCFDQLILAIESFAWKNKVTKIAVGCNTGCEEAYRLILNHGFVRDVQGVVMHRPNQEGFYKKDIFVLNDWR